MPAARPRVPAYLGLAAGELRRRIAAVEARLAACDLCPNRCGVDRMGNGRGLCASGALPIVSSYGPHHGEERVLVGRSGSGTIFFTHCTLKCVYCQNFDISWLGRGRETDYAGLSGMMLELQRRGCVNINLVSPTHQVYAILRALELAAAKGLRLPLVYNSGGYESLETLRLLDGVIDIYMPDIKYADEAVAHELSGISGYPDFAREAVREMHRQVGDLTIDADGLARRGLLVRHLVLPGGLAGTEQVVEFLAGLSKDSYLNIMDQYHPAFRARENAVLRRPPLRGDVDAALALARRAGLRRLDGHI